MARDKSRSLEWGTASKPKISNKTGNPTPAEGSDGEIQVRQTSLGARIFAKLGGKWLSSRLERDDINDPNIVNIRAWHKEGVTAAVTTGALGMKIYLPNYMNQEKILGVLFGIAITGNNYEFWSQGSRKMASSDEADAVSGSIHQAENHLRVRYNNASNYISIESPSYSGRPTLDITEKPYKLTVIFK